MARTPQARNVDFPKGFCRFIDNRKICRGGFFLPRPPQREKACFPIVSEHFRGANVGGFFFCQIHCRRPVKHKPSACYITCLVHRILCQCTAFRRKKLGFKIMQKPEARTAFAKPKQTRGARFPRNLGNPYENQGFQHSSCLCIARGTVWST